MKDEREREHHFARRIGDDAIRLERALAASPERVWRALTTPDDVAVWLGELATIELHVGGRYVLQFNDEERMNGTIVEIETNRRLVLTWREGPNESLVTFELARTQGGGTTLVLTHRKVRAGEQTIGLGAGWHTHLDALEVWLVDAAPLDRAAAYESLKPMYVARFA
jgi:uncharacterized protein YndB with AHSA1/START domain